MLREQTGLQGTLTSRRVNETAWEDAVVLASEHFPQEARFDALDLSSISANSVVPLNTVLRELPGDRNSDLIAVCMAKSSCYEPVVLRVKVEMGPCSDTWGDDAAVLSASWDNGAAGKDNKEAGSSMSVLESLQRSRHLQYMRRWRHVPVWLTVHEPSDEIKAKIKDAGVQLVCGGDFLA